MVGERPSSPAHTQVVAVAFPLEAEQLAKEEHRSVRSRREGPRTVQSRGPRRRCPARLPSPRRGTSSAALCRSPDPADRPPTGGRGIPARWARSRPRSSGPGEAFSPAAGSESSRSSASPARSRRRRTRGFGLQAPGLSPSGRPGPSAQSGARKTVKSTFRPRRSASRTAASRRESHKPGLPDRVDWTGATIRRIGATGHQSGPVRRSHRPFG